MPCLFYYHRLSSLAAPTKTELVFSFVEQKDYKKYLTDKYPDKKLAVLSCMDTRLTELLPAALGLKNGDAKIIKNAGGLVISAFDSAMRSLIVAIYELGVDIIRIARRDYLND